MRSGKTSVGTKNIPWRIAVIVVGAFASAIYGFASRNVEDSQKVNAKVWSSDDCLQCHRDAKSIQKMQSKRGNTEYCKPELQALLAAGKSNGNAKPEAKSYTKTW